MVEFILSFNNTKNDSLETFPAHGLVSELFSKLQDTDNIVTIAHLAHGRGDYFRVNGHLLKGLSQQSSADSAECQLSCLTSTVRAIYFSHLLSGKRWLPLATKCTVFADRRISGDGQDLKKFIRDLESKKWEFYLIALGPEALQNAELLGVPADNAVDYLQDPQDTLRLLSRIAN